MRFTDDDIKLRINGLQFKAYLEDSDINHVTKDQPLPFAPLSFTNDSMATRLNETAKFTFNVFSETREECINNYKNLLRLIESIKPIYYILDDQYVPSNLNVNGLVQLYFSGMPSRDEVKLHLTSFNYSLNKEIGYIQVPNVEINDPKSASFYNKPMKLIPLAYKVSLEGKVLLPFNSTIRKRGDRIQASNKEYSRALIEGAGSYDPAYIDKLEKIYMDVTNLNTGFATLPAKNLPGVMARVKRLADEYLVDDNGRYNEADPRIQTVESSLDDEERLKERRASYDKLIGELNQTKK